MTRHDHANHEPRRTHSRRLVGVRFLPAAATLGNLLCGFAAVFCCMLSVRAEYAAYFHVQPRVFDARLEQLFPTHIAAGAYLIVLAMLFDALDGRLARLTRRTSEFGAQLDSICDIVSFGLAPAALVVALLLRPIADTSPEISDASLVQVRLGMISAATYLCCAAIRLARFNAENVKGEAGQKAFSGLPSPGAAAAVVALLALHEHLRDIDFDLWGVSWPAWSRWAIIAITLATGLLMVSRLDYIHVFNVYVRRRRPPTHLVGLVLLLGIGWFSFQLLLVVVAFAYVLSGIVAGTLQKRALQSTDRPGTNRM